MQEFDWRCKHETLPPVSQQVVYIYGSPLDIKLCLPLPVPISNTTHLFLSLSSLAFLSFRNQMGNLLKVLTCTELEQGPNFFLDFESEHSYCLACVLPSLELYFCRAPLLTRVWEQFHFNTLPIAQLRSNSYFQLGLFFHWLN